MFFINKAFHIEYTYYWAKIIVLFVRLIRKKQNLMKKYAWHLSREISPIFLLNVTAINKKEH